MVDYAYLCKPKQRLVAQPSKIVVAKASLGCLIHLPDHSTALKNWSRSISGTMPRSMPIRAIRGAITVPDNSRGAILEATNALLQALVEANGLSARKVIAATFSVTPDLDQAYPAEAARGMGWSDAALMCVQEMRVEGALSNCIRVRVLWETVQPQSAIAHCYLREASKLRPDRLGD